ncbi:MAG: hypothetical protein EBU79_11965 [Betaproteobacteria bacterium]|nr:hypothetical protein [Betaproteobacteria bacterium]
MEGETIPHELSVAQLKSLTEAFLSTVARADRLGFDAIELHAAHGYLLHEFLSPIANQRQDAYGGSLENRMRFPLQLFTAMRAAWPAHKPMGLRLSATDWVEGSGWDIADACEFARRLEYLGADWIDVSSGGVSRAQQIKLGPGYQVPFAQAIKAVVKIPVIAVGLITEAKQAESILENNQADMVALGRGFLWDKRILAMRACTQYRHNLIAWFEQTNAMHNRQCFKMPACQGLLRNGFKASFGHARVVF